MVRGRWSGAVFRRWLLRSMILLAAGGAIAVAGFAIMILHYGAQDRARPADVIIVLGGGDAGTERRAGHAAALYRQGIAPAVLCVGGWQRSQSLTEAEWCAMVAQQHGIPAGAIALETRSLSTEENAIRAAALMRERGWQTAVLVSDDYHLWRARWMFSRQGVRVWTSPAQVTAGSLERIEKIVSVLREVAATGWYVSKSLLGLPHTRVGGG